MNVLAVAGNGAGPTGRLRSFVAAVSAAGDATTAMSAAATEAADAFGADVVIVTRGSTSVSTGPPVVGDGEPAGVAVLEGPEGGEIRVVRRGRPLTADEHLLLTGMAAVVVMAVRLLDLAGEARRLGASLRERQVLQERLSSIQRAIFQRAPIRDVLDAICLGAAELLGDDVVGLRLVDQDAPDELVLVASVGVGSEVVERLEWRTKIGMGVGGRAVSECRLVVEEDYASAPYHLAAFADDGIVAAMSAPIFEGARAIGSLTSATHAAARRYTDAESEVLQSFAAHASLALNDARTAEVLQETLQDAVHQATHDPLTGLINRAALIECLEEMILGERGDAVTVMIVDLDRFKLVNDSLGHDAGDEVLVATAERLQRCVRPGDVVGRHSADEFVVICGGLQGEVDALGLADRICRELAAPLALSMREVVVTASVGIARSAPGLSAEQVLRDADLAMYQAKERGRDRSELFGKSMRARLVDRIELEHALRSALVHHEFRLHYQPTMSLQSGLPVLVEALVRWERPDRGLVPPDQFIPVAEDTRLIIPIGAWVLREACREVAAWRRRSPALADMHVSVNLSACQFGDEHLLDLVQSALDESGLEPGALWLEITETVVMDGVESTIERLRALKALGVHLSIDDFGTGYSSLSYLKRFPVDVLKIDRSFVDGFGTDSEDEAIVTAVVRLAQALGKEVVAEGIENTLQLVGLSELGCDAGQGFFFSRPEPPDVIVPWLEERFAR